MLYGDKKPLVSILINCYNSENYISKAIKSVLNQSYKNWELIIWDDGSNDNTKSIISKFSDKRIKFFPQISNNGLGKSRIKASEKLSGSLISILDSDDYFHRDKILKQVEIFEKFPNVSLCSTWSKFYSQKGKLIGLFDNDEEIHKLQKKLKFINLLPHSSLMYKKQTAQKKGWYSPDLEYSQDYDLTLKLIKNESLYLIKEHLTFIVDHPNNMTNSKSLKILKLKENLLILENNLKKKNTDEEKKIINLIKDIYNLKLSVIEMNKNFIKNLKKLISIIIKNPFIFLKLNIFNKIKKNKI